MKNKLLLRAGALSAGALLLGWTAAAPARAGSAASPVSARVGQDNKDKNQGPKVSDGERKLGMQVNTAADPAAKLRAAAEFLKKYPKSALRPELAGYVAEQLAAVQDPAQKITLGETYAATFDDPSEAALVTPLLLGAYVEAKRFDDAFRAAGPWLEKHPDDLTTRTQLAFVGTNEAVSNQNSKFLAQSRQYATRALELLEADRMPASFGDAAAWAEYKSSWMPKLYQAKAIIAIVSGDKAEGRANLEKAAALKSGDPQIYAMLANLADEEYTALAEKATSTKAPADRDAALKQMDRVIEFYAQATALAEGKPEYQSMRDQIRPALENYYKFRHGGKTDGLQQLIDKHKQPAPAP